MTTAGAVERVTTLHSRSGMYGFILTSGQESKPIQPNIYCTARKRQAAVTAHFTSKQLLLFSFAGQRSGFRFVSWSGVVLSGAMACHVKEISKVTEKANKRACHAKANSGNCCLFTCHSK